MFGVLAALTMAGSLVAVPPAYAEIDPTAMDNAVFSAYMRATAKSEADFVKSVVSSAEMLDWRVLNPQATKDQLFDHYLWVARHREEASTAFSGLWERSEHEMLAWTIADLPHAPQAEYRGPTVSVLVAAMTGRDAERMSPRIKDRLTANEQYFDGERRYSEAPGLVWAAVANRARQDPVFKQVWDGEIGAAHKWVSATDSAQTMSDHPMLSMYYDLPSILSKKNDPVAVKQEVINQVAELGKGINREYSKIIDVIKEAAGKNVPGAPPKPDEKVPVEKAEDEQKQRQDVIDGIKAGFDGLSYIAGALGQHDFAQQVMKVGEAGSKFATASNKLLSFMQTAGEISGFATAAAMGNFAGALISVVSMFTAGPPSIEQVILSQIAELRKEVQRLGRDMNARFDQIDSRLKEVYGKLAAEFERTNARVEEVRLIAKDIASNVLHHQARTQAIGEATLDAIADMERDKLLEWANLGVDYSRAHQGDPIPKQTFVDAENIFNAYGTQNTTSAAYVVPEGRYTTEQEAVSTLLKLYGDPTKSFGPTGAIRFLAWYANESKLAPGFPVPPSGKIANPAVWALAANAYTLMTDQNRAMAATSVARWRADDVITVGKDIQNAIQQFVLYGQVEPGKASLLYQNLMTKYRVAMRDFLNSLRVHENAARDGKKYELFGNYEQAIPADHGMPVAADMPHCSGLSTLPRIKTPANATGLDLSPAVMFARYLRFKSDMPEPAYTPCYSAQWVNTRVETGTDPLTGKRITVKFGDLQISARQFMVWTPTTGLVEARRMSAVVKKNVEIQFCMWDGPTGPRACKPIEERSEHEEAAKGWEPEFRQAFEKTAKPENIPDLARSDGLGKIFTGEYLDKRKGTYYKKVSESLDTAPARDVDFAVQLLRAYTEVGLSRVLESDDQMKALLYGERQLYSTPLLKQLFGKAKANYESGTMDPFAGQTALEKADAQPYPPGLESPDRFSAWLMHSAGVRTDRLSTRLDVPFASFDDQSLPEVQHALTKLQIVTDAIHGRKN